MTETTRRMSNWPPIYLASGSARRKAILEELDIPYRPLPVDTEEIVAATGRETVEENASRKVRAALRLAERGAIVIAADTVLEVQAGATGPQTHDSAFGRGSPTQNFALGVPSPRHVSPLLLGKPADEATATQYLQVLSGSTATAYSAVAVAAAGDPDGCLATETAKVHFKTLPPEVIQWYVSTGEPMGRAGAFGIGRLGEILTESVDGCYSCVSGLPKTALVLALARVASEQMPELLGHVPTVLAGTRVQLRCLAV